MSCSATVEPWLSRLELEAGGKLIVDEKDAVTTVLVARRRFLTEHRDLVRRFAAAHRELTEMIRQNPEQAQRMLRGLRGLDLIGGDVVEVSPPFDMSGNTALVGVTTMWEILCLLSEAVARRKGRI